MPGSWHGLATRKGQLLEMGASLRVGKSVLQTVLDDFPEEAHGSAMLEQAIGLVGRIEDEIGFAANELSS